MTMWRSAVHALEPTTWKGLTGLPSGSRAFYEHLVAVGIAQALVVIAAFLTFDAQAHIAGLALVPVGMAAWSFGKKPGLLVALLNTPIVVITDLLGHSWLDAPLEILPLFATAWFIADLSRLVAKQNDDARELSRAHAVLAATLDGTDRPIAQFDAKGRLVHANAAYYKAHGCAPEQVRGKTHAEAFGCRDHETNLRQVLAERRPMKAVEQPLACMRSDDGPTYWDWSLEPLANDGAGVIITLEDVTERRRSRLAREEAEEKVRESEANFRQVADNVSEIIFLMSADLSKMHYVNPAYEKVSGYSVEEIMSSPAIWLTRLTPNDRETVMELLTTKVMQGEPASTDIEIRTPAGVVRWGHVVAFPVKDAAGNVQRVAGIVEDVTERRLAFDAALKAKEQQHEIEKLRAVTAFKTTFLNTAAHELATPITPIQFQLEALKEGWAGDLRPEQREAVDILARSVSRLTVLVQDLLDAARLESGRLRLHPKDVDLRATVEEAMRPFHRTAEAAHVALVLEAGAPVPLRVDPGRISQAVTNLVDNAVRYTPEGGTVRVSVSEENGEGVVRVQDTGRGLDAEQIGRLFQPFTQVQPDGPYRGAQGSGLGLFITRGIVENHGGRIWCASEGPGKGTTFSFAVPRVPAASASGSASASASAAASASIPPPTPAPRSA